jgi:hypothetical protein
MVSSMVSSTPRPSPTQPHRNNASTSPPHFLVDSSFSVSTASPFLHVPHPDMSMPFNVITLTGTVFAFIIGTVFNVTVRKGGKSIKEVRRMDKKRKSIARRREVTILTRCLYVIVTRYALFTT